MGARDVYDALAALQARAASGWVMLPGGCIEWKGPGAPPRGLPLARAAEGQGGASGATYGLVVVDDAVAGAASGDKEPVASAPFFVAVGTDGVFTVFSSEQLVSGLGAARLGRKNSG